MNLVANSDYGPIILNVFDREIGQSILKTGFWGRGDLEWIKKICDNILGRKGSICFYDVGANIGTHTLALSKTYGTRIKVRAFEAQSFIFNMLCGTIALNNICNVYPHHLAVSNENGQSITINLPDYTKVNNFGGLEVLPPHRSDNHSMVRSGITECVKTIALDSFQEDVDFIKLDIEGMEHLAVQGASRILRECRPFLYVEIIKADSQVLFDELKSYNYRIYILKGNALCIPDESNLTLTGVTFI